jgi:hypothetical protein
MGQNVLLSDRSTVDHILAAVLRMKSRSPELAKEL